MKTMTREEMKKNLSRRTLSTKAYVRGLRFTKLAMLVNQI